MTLVSKFALAAAVAVGMYVATPGLLLPESCAAPSPSCGSDLRECLRLSADMNPPAPFGVRYVTADQVAHCMEAFNSCIHGGASRGGNPVPSTSESSRRSSTGLPQHFTIDNEYGSTDCRITGDSVSCTATPKSNPDWVTSYSSTFTGQRSGLTVTGTMKERIVGTASGCLLTDEGSGPGTFTFSPNGTVTMRVGPMQWERLTGFGCSNTDPHTSPAGEVTGNWSEAE